MGNFTTVPDVVVGQNFPPSLWESAIMNNLNLGVTRQLADTTLGGATATIAFSSIPATFAHLLLVGQGRGDTAATATNLNLRLNGDSATNYSTQQVQGSSATASAAVTTAQTSAGIASMAAASATAGVFSPVFAFLPNYAGTVAQKDLLALDLFIGTPVVQLIGGHWASTSAINSITLLPGAGNFIAGTRFTLYGLPA
jgi:hypothetical protein